MCSFFIQYSDIMHSVCVPLDSPLGFELMFTIIAQIWRSFYMLALNVSHQVSLLVDELVAHSTAPVLGPWSVHLAHTLLIDVGSYSVMLNKN